MDQNITVYVWSPAPSHSKTPQNPFVPLQIKWEVYIFSKKSSCVVIIASVYHCIGMYPVYIYMYISAWISRWQYNIAGSILLHGGTTWILTKRKEKKLDGNCTRMLRTVLNKSWKQHSTQQHLYDHSLPISQTI